MCYISFLFVTFVPRTKAIRRFVFMEHLMNELRKMEMAMENGVARKNPLRLRTLKKLIGYLLGTDKPKRERLPVAAAGISKLGGPEESIARNRRR